MRKIYKKKKDGTWGNYYSVKFPDGTVMNENNKEPKDGFFWSDEPPKEYTDWKKEQEYLQ